MIFLLLSEIQTSISEANICLESRQQKRLTTRLKQAKLPEVKTLDTFDFKAGPKLPRTPVLALAEGKFIRDRENIICVEQSGTGKTHIATAVGVPAIQQGFKVRFIRIVDLIQELLKTESEYRLPKHLKSWNKFDLVIIDELGYINLGAGSPLLFQFCSERYEKGSLVITTNLEFGRWGEVFGDNALSMVSRGCGQKPGH